MLLGLPVISHFVFHRVNKDHLERLVTEESGYFFVFQNVKYHKKGHTIQETARKLL